MRPHRVRLTHSLVENYHLNQRMLVHRPEARSKEQIENFHCDGALSVASPSCMFWWRFICLPFTGQYRLS